MLKKSRKTGKLVLEYPFTHTDRVFYPEQDITKLQLAQYYEKIQNYILPYIINRPLTLVRCPKGYLKKCFYQKHIHESQPKGLYLIDIVEKNKKEKYIYIKDFEGLLALVQLGVLEIHPWGSRIDAVEKPDMITFDLDPGPHVAWKKVIETAIFIRELLANVNLKSFVKTTGGKGLHVVLPIKRQFSWEQIKSFSHTVVDYIVSQNPQEYIGTLSKAKREGKIYIDYLRNQRGATAIAPYSTRAKENAPVATPLSWRELNPRIHADTFTVTNLQNRFAKLKRDPWEDFFHVHQSLRDLA